MIPTTAKNFPIADIVIPRDVRQRTSLTFASVFELAKSIAETGTLLQNIGINGDTNEIIYGERRLTSIKLLRLLYSAQPHLPSIPELTPEQVRELQTLAAKPPSWSDNWTKIPARVGRNLTQLQLQVFEFIENVHRAELSWQDKCKAVHTIHIAGLNSGAESWSGADTAKAIGLTASMANLYLDIWVSYIKGDDDLKAQILASETVNAAAQLIRRVKARSEPQFSFKHVSSPAPAPAPTAAPAAAPAPAPPPDDLPIINADFHEWAASYSGPPFNFIHCDFPYGINFNKSNSQSAAADTKALGEYDDSEEVYWDLLTTLAKHKDSIMADSCHLMFWFSQNLREKTLDFFDEYFPYAKVQPHLMIWARTIEAGIVPDPQRYGRRNYDTALLLSFGDRLIVKPQALAFTAPWGDRIHRSQKPIDVLTHFFGMFVDKTSAVLDPTCGSGTSLLAAKKLGANRILGIVKDPAAYNRARAFLHSLW